MRRYLKVYFGKEGRSTKGTGIFTWSDPVQNNNLKFIITGFTRWCRLFIKNIGFVWTFLLRNEFLVINT